MQNKKNIHIAFFPFNDSNTGSSRIRVFNLLRPLKELGATVSINPRNIKGVDIIVFQKVGFDVFKDILAQAHYYKIPTVFDIDDYFEHINADLHRFDYVIASTQYLANSLKQYNKSTYVVPNCLDIDNYDIPLKLDLGFTGNVWFGWSTNSKILTTLNITDVTTIMDNGDIEFSKETIDSDLQKFNLILIPQEKNTHTLCKTHCRMLKSLYLGVPCLVSDMPEYVELATLVGFPQSFIVKDNEDWNKKINDYKEGRLPFQLDFAKTRKIILENFSSENIAHTLLKILEKQIIDYKKQEHSMKIFERIQSSNGRQYIYFCGIKIASYTRYKHRYLALKKQYEEERNSWNPFVFYWDAVWLKYIKNHDINQLCSELKSGMDSISAEYIDMFISLINLLPFKDAMRHTKDFGWTSKDLEYIRIAQHYQSPLVLPSKTFFYFANKYGMADIPEEVLHRIDERTIIDGGAFDGYTALLFSEMFSNSKIISLEPNSGSFKKLLETLQKYNLENRVTPLQKGLGNTKDTFTLSKSGDCDAGATLTQNRPDNVLQESVDVTTIDTIAGTFDSKIGFIKLDIEGFEKKALEGATETIKRDKPVIVAALYHNPVDFFEIKQFLLDIHPDYKFMIRRSEMVIPLGDIILIAY